MLSAQFHPTTYNNLDGADEAYAALQERDSFSSFLDEFRALTEVSPLRDYLGASLLHRHFSVALAERLVERPKVMQDGTHALVAAPSSKAEGVPTRWRLSGDGTFVPLEFSVDEGPTRMIDTVASQDSLLADYAALLRRHQLSDLIGLGLFASEHVVPQMGMIRTEVTSADGSVVTLQPDDDEPNWVSTAWLPAVTSKCQLRCLDRCRPAGDHHMRVHLNRHESTGY